MTLTKKMKKKLREDYEVELTAERAARETELIAAYELKRIADTKEAVEAAELNAEEGEFMETFEMLDNDPRERTEEIDKETL